MSEGKNFSLQEIEVFAAVMRYGTVTKAADCLDIAQPRVSKVVAQFEAKAGLTLFHRVRRRLVPTSEAVSLYTIVERSFVSAREITRAAQEIKDLRPGWLRVGVLPALGSGLIPHLIHDFLKVHPAVTMTVNVHSTKLLVEMAARGQIDVAIGVTENFDNPAIVRRQLPAVPVVCVLPATHPLAEHKSIHVEDLQGQPLVSLLQSDQHTLQVQHCAAIHGVKLLTAIETNLARTAIDFVTLGRGVATIDYLALQGVPMNELTVRPFVPEISCGYSLYRQGGEVLSRVTSDFIDFATQKIKALALECTAASSDRLLPT